jgi:predicted Zn-dependent protease
MSGRERSRGETPRLLSVETCSAVVDRVLNLARGGGTTTAGIIGWWTGGLRWARSRVSLASDRRDLALIIGRRIEGSAASALTNQLDDTSVEAALRAAERMARLYPKRDAVDLRRPAPAFEIPKAAIWSDATYNLGTEARGAVVRNAIGPAESAGMLSAGYLEMLAQTVVAVEDDRRLPFTEVTQAQCSLTVRDRSGMASGWAGLSSYDWGTIDPGGLADRALQKALASRNPVALEPGRYTVILEPQAVHDLVSLLVAALDRSYAEQGQGPFAQGHDAALNLHRTKLGLKVVDSRVTIDHDPADPMLGVVHNLVPYRPVTWIERGVLKRLADPHREYSLHTRTEHWPFAQSEAFRMHGGETTLDEMIRTTRRGLLVTRLSNVRLLDPGSALATGTTRDGLWLIENGEIVKAVRNFRFTESPLFVLNSLEQLGPAVPVLRLPANRGMITPAIVPPLKARDFSFTSMVDAV